MADKNVTEYVFEHRQIDVEGLSIHVVQRGQANKPAMLFLHGWPENWALYEKLLTELGQDVYGVAIDLPGVGGSTTPPPSNDKRTLARYVHGVVKALDLHDVTLVGHDAGGQIVYAYLHAYPDELARAVIMDVAVPGVDPWSEVLKNPYIWHFAFHAIPQLPETMVVGREEAYFAYFFNLLAGPNGVSEDLRQRFVEAYKRPDALRTGFEWYRAFAQDEKDNLAVKGHFIETPVLYVRGAREKIDIEKYLEGFRMSGLRNIQPHIIPDSGHFTPAEQPAALAAALRDFLKSDVRPRTLQS
jgi:pimeloyl-ACP methyl ester carboxylesterase